MGSSEVRRLEPGAVRRRMDSGKAILGCGYDADEKFQPLRLEGAESLNHFLERLPAVSTDQELSSTAADRRSTPLPVGQSSFWKRAIGTARR